MKIYFSHHEKELRLYFPLMLICNKVGAALVAGGLRLTSREKAQEGGGSTALVTAAQIHLVLKALRQSRQALQKAQLPLIVFLSKDGDKVIITL